MEKHPERWREGIVRADGSVSAWNAGDVVAVVVDAFSAKGIPLASRHKGMIAKQAKELLEDGFEPPTIIVAAVMALKRGAPQNLHFIASDLVMARSGERMTRREYEQVLQDEMEIGGARRG